MKCELCGLSFNPANLSEVFEHQHSGIELSIPDPKSKRVIKNARDVYPNCGGMFASGVHQYLKGLPMPERPCDDVMIQGWMSAERDLKDNYILESQP